VRQTGALSALPFVLGTGTSVYAFLGELRAAALLEEELKAATEATGIAAVPYGRLSLAALRGREVEFSDLIRTTVGEAEARGEGLALTVAEFLSGALYNGLGRYDAALTAVSPAERFYTEGPAIWTLTELIEAAVRSGQPERARRAFERVQETTRPAGTDWALGIEARSRALLSDGDDTEELYREAITRLRRTSIRVQLARTHLLYGEWLRRERRRLDAREELRTAYELFTDFGVEAFAERARLELQATGERARKRTADTLDQLTPAGDPDRSSCGGRPHQSRDRRSPVHQREHSGVPPAQGVPQARRQVAHTAGRPTVVVPTTAGVGCRSPGRAVRDGGKLLNRWDLAMTHHPRARDDSAASNRPRRTKPMSAIGNGRAGPAPKTRRNRVIR
jgi:tetratricopeptide (TPR) repeat protein